MDRVITPFTYEKLARAVVDELRKSIRLTYVPDDAILFVGGNDKDVVPTFATYLIRVMAPDSGFLEKTPRIGRYFRNKYTLAIELWVKNSSALANRPLGQAGATKGIYDFFQDVSDTLVHNTLDDQLDPYAGSDIESPTSLTDDENTMEGIGFLWSCNQDNVH